MKKEGEETLPNSQARSRINRIQKYSVASISPPTQSSVRMRCMRVCFGLGLVCFVKMFCYVLVCSVSLFFAFVLLLIFISFLLVI